MTSATTTIPLTQRVPLGRTGFQVSPLGLGGAWIGQTADGVKDELAVRTVVRAVELGINVIDTSGAYQRGESERLIGLALDELRRRGVRREDLLISSKTGTRSHPHDYSGDGTKRSIETSLKALRTDYLDIALVHDPHSLEPVLAPGAALDTLQQLREQRVVRAIGLGVRDRGFHCQLIESGRIDVSLTYHDYNLLYRQAADDLLPAAAAHGVGVMNGMAVLGGLLGGRDPLEVAGELGSPTLGARHNIYHARGTEAERARAFWEFARSKNVPLLALNLQFIFREPRIAATLLGASSPEEIEEDVRMAQLPLPDDIWSAPL
jgi:D-threo-aldose 1-dehydrogenase